MTNKEPKYTSAPWYSDEITIWTGGERLSDNGGYIIAETYGTDKLANAQLISAAPELLQALELALSILKLYAMSNEEAAHCHLTAEQAINKALTL